MLASHAFAAEVPTEDHAEAVNLALRVCGRLPLALRVLGHALRFRLPLDKVRMQFAQCVAKLCPSIN